MSDVKYVSGAQIFESWTQDVVNGEPPVRWACGAAALSESVDLGPGLITLIGGAPGAGKTCLSMGMTFDAVRTHDNLKALVLNVEMGEQMLLVRELSRQSGIPLDVIQRRRVLQLPDAAQTRLLACMAEMRGPLDRMFFLQFPHSLEHLAFAAHELDAELICIDYLQRLHAPGEHASQREALDCAMAWLRRMADAGAGLLVLSAIARSRGRAGSDYETVSLASFRGSGEVEYGADSAFALVPAKDGSTNMLLQCLKRRHGEERDVLLDFDREHQNFVPVCSSAKGAFSMDRRARHGEAEYN